ncbi:diaminopimelate epimerase [Prosthecomicrobium pneumaticum]|uniref:Diaminopimelate epimerase n=1 Tax=Prosthecomicrobium pneumaticum TaxID=81895 RepID=A0A7W9L2F4_9HYPH|nr:diaminopimelate epimerase [Prosthecomicrobium pneumaticum]MBB5753474.1 diaminopimelate epimerase [Prosthecomicrobium pneumaticum]
MKLPFAKMNGIGNRITVLDTRGTDATVDAGLARTLAADRATEFDQLMVIGDPRTAGTDAFLAIYNTDGSMSAACGNGTRCVALYLTADAPRAALRLETEAGLLDTTFAADGTITVDMGPPRFGWADIPLAHPVADTDALDLAFGPVDAPLLSAPAVASMGNPHAVFFVDDVEAYDLGRIGPILEHHPLFPQRANISLVRVTGPDAVTAKVWERGAGLTLACGSAACAIAVLAARTGRTGRRVAVRLPGGTLDILWREDGNVLMSGPAAFEHRGTVGLDGGVSIMVGLLPAVQAV